MLEWLAAALKRGVYFRRTLGWKRFLFRLAMFWLWVPRLLNAARGRLPSDPAASPKPLDPRQRRPFGVNVLGSFFSASGLGQVSRQATAILRASGIPFSANDVPGYSLSGEGAFPEKISQSNPFAFNMVCLNVTDAVEIFWRKGHSYFDGHYNIASWVWEMPELPPECQQAANIYDEIWAPSDFVAAAVRKAGDFPVVRIPYAVQPLPQRPERQRRDFGIPEDGFVFFFAFHYWSLLERKNPLGLVQAFQAAFPNEANVSLILKTSGPPASRATDLLRESAKTPAKVLILDRPMSRPEINDLFLLSDCYVSLHRAEGFGLTIAEAMSAGKPVIATAYGGNVDFMTDANSYPVPYETVPLTTDLGPYRRGLTWAEPDLETAASLMRRVYDNREESLGKGQKAKEDVARLLSVEHVGQLVRQRLEEIAREKGVPTDD